MFGTSLEKDFIAPSNQPIVFEIITSAEDEFESYKLLTKSDDKSAKGMLKDVTKKFLEGGL